MLFSQKAMKIQLDRSNQFISLVPVAAPSTQRRPSPPVSWTVCQEAFSPCQSWSKQNRHVRQRNEIRKKKLGGKEC